MNGVRHYKLANCEVTIRSETVNRLKFANIRYPTILYDSKYLCEIAKEVFGTDCLKQSLVLGRNPKRAHAALDKTKLKFVRGLVSVTQSTFSSRNPKFTQCRNYLLFFQIYF